MNKIDWKQKLTSRKLWVAVANLITMLLIASKVDSDTVAQVVAIIMASGGIVAYIFAEGWVDVEEKRSTFKIDDGEEK